MVEETLTLVCVMWSDPIWIHVLCSDSMWFYLYHILPNWLWEYKLSESQWPHLQNGYRLFCLNCVFQGNQRAPEAESYLKFSSSKSERNSGLPFLPLRHSGRQRNLACCSLWGCRVVHNLATEQQGPCIFLFLFSVPPHLCLPLLWMCYTPSLVVPKLTENSMSSLANKDQSEKSHPSA